MIKHLIIDEEGSKRIESSIKNIAQSSSISPILMREVKELVYPVLDKHNINKHLYYGDMYYRQELVKFKFVIDPTDDVDLILEELNQALSKEYNIQRITYYDEDNTMIFIWM